MRRSIILWALVGVLAVAGVAVAYVTAAMTDESTMEGVAVATILRSDYGIGIPNAPGVADVGDEVVIRLEFVATT